MKKLLIGFMALNLVFLGCKKEEDSPAPTSSYVAKIDGVSWKARTITASVFNGTTIVMAESSDGTSITFSLNNDSIGLYPVNEKSNSTASYSLGTGNILDFTSGSSSLAGGQILIESISYTKKTMTGSIEFKAVRSSDDSTIIISEGRFQNIKFDNLPIGIGENTLEAQVNGSKWAPQDVSGFVAFKTLYLTALDADGVRTLNFELPELIAPGKYELNYFTNYKAVYTNIADKKHYVTNGTLEIISHNLVNQEIEAKFDMITEAHDVGEKIKFSEGEFTITYE